jgi:isochorismate synthase
MNNLSQSSMAEQINSHYLTSLEPITDIFNSFIGKEVKSKESTAGSIKIHYEVVCSVSTYDSEKNQLVYQWGEKEREEQQIVTDYIAAILSSTALKNISISTPETFSAGNLVHLKSTIKAMVSSTAQLRELLLNLHPTPAVGGLPKDEAMKIILKEEQHPRQYYTGFLGLWNGEINTNLYVNLRCAEMTNTQIIYYAGCGITSNSDPEKEWQETERKIDTLRQVFLALEQ